ncbi:DUF6519 domain-containing protein [Myxococcus sp. RHSTA-1-4]|uniref:DUF6519 domain-containing protein n=1 Tax=Myxococcus sp. RHSTA-1-4 TaxID=2874601 RepID=UPI001CBD4ACD|nr:DUF6519 domain-containing protein [Myxococcus sp. RHSTA-1-4]MBZ4420181.1 hypothetical protein [Myxococcus sp. RHSTA-1-4]
MDITRSSHDSRKHYDAMRALQGRMLTDDDLNVSDILAKEERRAERVHVIGPHGSPDDGFSIANPSLTEFDGGTLIDFDIRPGTLYVGGLRLELEPGGERFSGQRDWLQQTRKDRTAIGRASRVDLVYVEAWQQPVTATEDGELLEEALGGVDTTARLRTMRRVRLFQDVRTEDALVAWDKLRDKLGLSDEGERRSEARLTVGFEQSGLPEDLCTPGVEGGYLGADNQAIRVELVGGSKLVWGYDNGGPLYRVNVSGDKVTLRTPPRDEVHWPRTGQTVEIIPWSAILPNGEKVAEARGPLPPDVGPSYFATVTSSYDPETGELRVDKPLPQRFNEGDWTRRYPPDVSAVLEDRGEDRAYVFMRVWHRGSDESALPTSYTPNVPVMLGNTGLLVTVSGAQQQAGDHWVIAVRPRSASTVVPWQLIAPGKRPPEGPRRFYAPLALLVWKDDTAEVIDCRARFLPLTLLGGSCALTVSPRAGWEHLFEHLPAGKDLHLCFGPGTYRVPRVLKVSGGQVKISGAGSGTRLLAPDQESVFRFEGCKSVTVRDLYAEAGLASSGQQHLNGVLSFSDCGPVTMEGVTLQCGMGEERAASCVSVVNSPDHPLVDVPVRIRGCDLRIGAQQVGILVINAKRTHIEGNTLAMAPALLDGKPLRGEELLKFRSYVKRLRQVLMRSLLINPESSPDMSLGTVKLVLEYDHPRHKQFNVFFQTPQGLAEQEGAAWKEAKELLPPPREEELGVPWVRRMLLSLAEDAVRGGRVSEIPAFKNWRTHALGRLTPVALQGIVVGGQVAEDVRIVGNTLRDVQQGIHVGLSRRQQGMTRIDVGRVFIQGNNVEVRVPVDAVHQRHGIFVGSCNNLAILDNHVDVALEASDLKTQAILVKGTLGRLALIQRNHVEGGSVGIAVTALNNDPEDSEFGVWKASENLAEKFDNTPFEWANGMIQVDNRGLD